LRTLGFALLALVALAFDGRADAASRAPRHLPLLPVASALPADELRDLAKVKEWLASPADVPGAAKRLVEEIREDRQSFEMFAGFHTEQERSAALVSTPYGREIAGAAEEHDVDCLLVASVVEVESTFRPGVGSHKGAVGLMQLLPDTAGLSRRKLKNPCTNLDAGAAYLAKLIDRFDGDLGLALAAYNAGPTNVRRYNGVPPFPETQQYVQKVLARYVDYHRQLWHSSGALDLLATAS
jgi:soluble lytic murein transglycosylase-like protein